MNNISEDDFSAEEMIMMHEDDDEHDENDHEMSIVDDNNNASTKEYHINLFGEIVHDDLENDMVLTRNSNKAGVVKDQGVPVNLSSHEVSELLIHPANFRNSLDSNQDGNVDMKEVSVSMFLVAPDIVADKKMLTERDFDNDILQ